jgi:vacuolar-type H+-ATPase subunit C/Vma6
MGPDTGLIARARGLLRHLVPRATLETLAECADLSAFRRAASRLGADLEPVAEPWELATFERAVRQTAAHHLTTLGRWRLAQASAIDIFTDDLDRQSVRRLIRGAVIGAPVAVRLEGLTPTLRLPERVLTELARQPSPAAVAGLLAAAGHPDARALAPIVAATQPELFAIDRTLLAGYAARSIAAAGRDRLLGELVALRIDLGNAQVALLVASGPRDVDPSNAHITGGRVLTPKHFAAATTAPSPGEALMVLQRALTGTALEPLLPSVASDVESMDRRYLSYALDQLRTCLRQEPIDTAMVFRTLLRIDAQGRDLRMLAWGAALGTPPPLRKDALVTPWA